MKTFSGLKLSLYCEQNKVGMPSVVLKFSMWVCF